MALNPIDFPKTTKEALENYEKERSRSYSTDKYRWNNHQYPTGLGTDPDLLHYVAFYINVREKSMERNPNAFETLGKNEVNILRTTQKLTPDRLAEKLPEIVGVQTALMSLGISTVSGIADKLGSSKGAAPIKGGARAGGAAAVVKVYESLKSLGTAGLLGYAAAELTEGALKIPILAKTSFLRLKDVISLHIEERPTVKYGMNYTEADLGLLAGLIASGAAGIDSVKDFISDFVSGQGFKPGEGTAAILTSLAKLPMGIGGGRAQDILGATSGVKINPFREALFESIDYRTFNFKYRFFPKTEKESNNVKRIIDTFKIHMHPDLSASNLFYIYPSEFEIVYYYVNPVTNENYENPYLYRIGNCALTDMAVEYGGDTFSTFENGAPTQINLTLTFRELEQLTKREMRQGF